jgi:peptide methionine sulfoxide reductase MsrA
MDSIENAKELKTNDGSDIAHAYNFFAAASYHRNYVLKRLLPEAGLYVV